MRDSAWTKWAEVAGDDIGESASQQQWLKLLLIAVVLTIATIAAFHGVGNNGFVSMDDYDYVVENRHVNQGLSWEGVKWAFTSFHVANWHPLTWLSHMLDVSLFGMRAGGHHMVNLFFHVLNMLLLLTLLNYTTRSLWASAFVAGLFALHPLHVESVAWVAERKDVLSTFFWLATMLAYAFYARRPGRARYAGVVVLFAIGLMSKPMLVTLPLILLLLDYWPLERLELNRLSVQRLIIEKFPLFAMAAAMAIVTMSAQKIAMIPLDRIDLPTRLENVIISYWRYIVDMVWPVNLAALYPFKHVPGWSVAGIGAMLMAVTVALLYMGRRVKFLAVGWLWYIITLIPVIGLVQVGDQSRADRYTYIPLVGLFVMVSWGVSQLVGRRGVSAKIAVPAGAIVLICAGAATSRQVGYWKDSYTLSSRALAVTKNNYRMLTLFATSQLERGEDEAAVVNLKRSDAGKPGHLETLSSLGLAMLRMQKYEEAARYCEAAIGIRPDLKQNWYNAALAYRGMGEIEKSKQYLKKTIELDPFCAPAYGELARTLCKAGSLDEGIAAYRKWLELDPALASGHVNLGLLYAKKKDFVSAAEEFKKELAVKPDGETWSYLAGAMAELGKFEDAEKAFRESIRLMPGGATTHYNLGVVLERMGRKADAIEEVKKAIELEPTNQDIRSYYRTLTGTEP